MEQTNPQIHTHTHVKTHKMINKSSQKFVIHIILHHYWFNQRDKWTLQRNLIIIFFLSGFSFTDTDSSQGGDHLFHSTTSTRSRTFRHLCATLHVRWLSFLIATLVFTRLLLYGIYHLIELLFDWLMMWFWFLFVCMMNWL